MTSNRGRLFFLSYARGVSGKPAPQFDSEFSEYMGLAEKMFLLTFQKKKLSCSSVGRFQIIEETLRRDNHLRNIEFCRELSSETYFEVLIFDFRGADLLIESDDIYDYDFFMNSSYEFLSKDQIRDFRTIIKNHDYCFRLAPTKEIIIFDHFGQSFAVRGEDVSDGMRIRDDVEMFKVRTIHKEENTNTEDRNFIDYLLDINNEIQSEKVIHLDARRRRDHPAVKIKRRRRSSFLDGILSDY